MNNLFSAIFISIFLSATCVANTIVISDIDDTIKQTNVLNKAKAAGSFVYKSPDFPALNEIFHQLRFYYAKDNVDFFYLSASPSCLLDYKSWIADKKFPVGNVIQRPCDVNWLQSNYATIFKYNSIVEIIKNRSLAGKISHIFLFGDNAEYDPMVYLKIKNTFPEISMDIFIRDIRVEATLVDATLPVRKLEGVNYFLTEYDLVKNTKFYFLSSQQKTAIYQDFKQAKLFPQYLYENLAKRYEKELEINDEDAMTLSYAALIKQLSFNSLDN